MHYIISVLLIWLFCLISVLLHELGHASGYRIAAGKAEWKVIAGSGPQIIGTKKYIIRCIPAGGYFIPEEVPKTDKGNILMLSGGPFFSLLLTVLFGVIRFCLFGYIQPESSFYGIFIPVSNFMLFFNFFQFLFTAIPVRDRVVCRGLESDGLQVLHILKSSKNKKTHE